jgi:tRNA dimethylallyltransferase
MKPKILVILGPTSSGKSDLAVDLALKFNGEIISADSRQVYKKMDLCTGKITRPEMKRIRHYCLNIANPKKRFSVAQYNKRATKDIKKILKKNKLPIICGGTGFYIDSMTKGSSIPKVKPNWKLRDKLEKLSTEQLFNRLQELDIERSKNIDNQNRRRLIRSIEIVETTKQPIPDITTNEEYNVLQIGITRDDLNERIRDRIIKRLERGMIEEVKSLRLSNERLEELGLEPKYISYFLQNKLSYNEMINQLEKETIKYSKRQMTWFNRDKSIRWIKNKKQAIKLVRSFVK